MANRFHNQRSRTARRSNKSWAFVGNTSFTTIAQGAKVLLGSFTLSNPGIDETILRSVGGVAIHSDQAAADEQQIGAFGLIMVTDTALALGITAIPGPFTDGSDDGWFLHVPFAQSIEFVSGVGVLVNSVWYPFDSGAKRVNHDGTAVALVVENGGASHGLRIAFSLRMLSMVTGT